MDDIEILSVSQLNRTVRANLERGFSLIWVSGEISNLARPSSGHLYFSLKDPGAQVRCALFRARAGLLGFAPANGMQVTARARVSLYEPRGDYQLLVEHLEETGSGALQRAYEALKRRLHAEGLFDIAHKKPLPALPHCVGLITSPSGAAVRDILQILRRRFPALPVRVYPVPVQGTEAPSALVHALHSANRDALCDVLVVTRGGGSLEDLRAFNDESVARAIYASAIPVVSAVGHEIDFTIADFVADQRAPTPSAAAELISPDGAAWLGRTRDLEQRLQHALRMRLERQHTRLDTLTKHVQHPGRRLQLLSQRLDELELRLMHAQQAALRRQRTRLQNSTLRLAHNTPRRHLERLHWRHDALRRRLTQAMQHRLDSARARFAELSHALDTVSPLATLHRGYAIVSAAGKIVRDAARVEAGQEVRARLAVGSLYCRVEKTVCEDS